MKRLLFFCAAICLLIACSKSDGFLGSGSLENTLKNGQNEPIVDLKYSPGTVYNLSGLSLYKTWEVSGKIWQDGSVPCVGTLEFLEGRNFKFTFQETVPDGNSAEYYGKISASGILTFKFPTPLAILPDGTKLYITDIIKEHACVEIWGEGVNDGTLVFKGKFDGTRFTATAKFMAKVASPSCPINDIIDPALVNGNLHWIFGYDLTVD